MYTQTASLGRYCVSIASHGKKCRHNEEAAKYGIITPDIVLVASFHRQFKRGFDTISCRRWTRATRCLTRIQLQTGVDAQCVKLTVGRSTVASFINLVRPTTVVRLSHLAPTFVELCS